MLFHHAAQRKSSGLSCWVFMLKNCKSW